FFGIGEPHRPDYAVSTPEIILAAAAPIPRRIRLGSAVTVLSSTDPVRVYQQYATIDHLSNGRAEITAGRGSFIESFPLYGYNLNDYEVLFEEKLDLLVRVNREERITWKGTMRPALQNQQVLPRAAQAEGLPIWVAVGGTPESVLRAARLGLPVIFAIIGGAPVQFQPMFDYYRKAYRQLGHDESRMQTGVHMHCFFGDDSNQVANDYYLHYAAQMDRVGSTRGWPPYQRRQFDFGRSRQGALVIGDANEAVDRILLLQEQLGLTRFAAHMDVGGPPHAALMKSIEIFGTKVAPAVRKALQRQEAVPTSPAS
ncbi:MAG TPA: LLM class flavin-dependent oxidoreductase, partial [Lacibacter sp.]|nr:LLM class flavin-dependent oxidoreductase [Lacibacter sp.]